EPTATVDFYPNVSGLATYYVVGAADVADGLRGEDDTRPFRFRRWMFAQENRARPEGEEGATSALLEAALPSIPDFLRRNLRGRSPAEIGFHLFLATLHELGALDDPRLTPPQIGRALRDAGRALAKASASAGLAWEPGNVVVTDGRALIAVRLGERPMFVRLLR